MQRENKDVKVGVISEDEEKQEDIFILMSTPKSDGCRWLDGSECKKKQKKHKHLLFQIPKFDPGSAAVCGQGNSCFKFPTWRSQS